MKCPNTECDYELNDNDIDSLTDQDLYKKYKDFKHRKLLSLNPNIRWCIRPGCDQYVIINNQKGSEKIACECGQQMCIKCANEYHPGRTCEQMIDVTYKEYAKQADLQTCSQCKSSVEKDQGCNHMKCAYI